MQHLPALELLPLMAAHPVVLVELSLRDAAGAVISRNVYWLAAHDSDYRHLNDLAPVAVATQVQIATQAATDDAHRGETAYRVTLTNPGKVPALAIKLTLLEAHSHLRLLPAYWSDNYVSLMPGESAEIVVHAPAAAAPAAIAIRGWNVVDAQVSVARP